MSPTCVVLRRCSGITGFFAQNTSMEIKVAVKTINPTPSPTIRPMCLFTASRSSSISTRMTKQRMAQLSVIIPRMSRDGRGASGISSVFSMLLSSSLEVSITGWLFFGRSLKKTIIAQTATKGMCTRNDLDRCKMISIYVSPSSIKGSD